MEPRNEIPLLGMTGPWMVGDGYLPIRRGRRCRRRGPAPGEDGHGEANCHRSQAEERHPPTTRALVHADSPNLSFDRS